VHLEAYAGFSVPDVLMSAAAAERGSAHPLAAALVGAAAAAAADTGLPATDMRSLQGKVSTCRVCACAVVLNAACPGCILARSVCFFHVCCILSS
jgi:cation transport ATPase